MNPLHPRPKRSCPIEPPEAYRAWCAAVFAAGAGSLQLNDIETYHHTVSHEKTTLYLAEVLARTTFECAMALYFAGMDNALDVWCRARILATYDAERLCDVEAHLASLRIAQPGGAQSPISLLNPDRPDLTGLNWYDKLGVRARFETSRALALDRFQKQHVPPQVTAPAQLGGEPRADLPRPACELWCEDPHCCDGCRNLCAARMVELPPGYHLGDPDA